jgi:hypothetical protein
MAASIMMIFQAGNNVRKEIRFFRRPPETTPALRICHKPRILEHST